MQAVSNSLVPACTTNLFRTPLSSVRAQFCNSYITLYYIAFFKPFASKNAWSFLGSDFDCIDDGAGESNCFEEVSTHLLAMFCTQLVIQNIINVAVPQCCGSSRSRRSRATARRSQGFNEQLIQHEDQSDPDMLPRYVEEAQSPARELVCPLHTCIHVVLVWKTCLSLDSSKLSIPISDSVLSSATFVFLQPPRSPMAVSIRAVPCALFHMLWHTGLTSV